MKEEKTTVNIMHTIGLAYSKLTQEEIMALYRSIPDVNAISEDRGKSYIQLAAEFADPEAMEYLIAKGAKAGSKNEYGETALHYLGIKSLDNCSRFIKDESILASRIEKCTDILIKAKVSALFRDNGSTGGNLCYHGAMKAGNLFFIHSLIKNRVKLDMLDKDYGRNLLHLLVLNPAKKSKESIGYAINQKKGEEAIAKLEDILERCFLLAKELIEFGIDPEAKDNRNTSAFEYAVEHDLKKLAVLLQGEYDESDPKLKDKLAVGGKTLHQAADTGDLVAVEAFIRLGTDLNEVNTEQYGKYQNKTPLAIACCKLHENCVKALLDAGADVNFRGGEQGCSAFFHMYREAKISSYQMGKDNTVDKVLKLLFNAGIDPDGFVNDEELTPINLACHHTYCRDERHCKEFIRTKLLEMGVCNYNIADINGFTPLMGRACEESGTPENEVIMLLEGEADMTFRDNKGNTALMYAAKNSKHDHGMAIADLLFGFGNPKPEATNNDGKTALDLAIENNNENLVKFLLNQQ